MNTTSTGTTNTGTTTTTGPTDATDSEPPDTTNTSDTTDISDTPAPTDTADPDPTTDGDGDDDDDTVIYETFYQVHVPLCINGANYDDDIILEALSNLFSNEENSYNIVAFSLGSDGDSFNVTVQVETQNASTVSMHAYQGTLCHALVNALDDNNDASCSVCDELWTNTIEREVTSSTGDDDDGDDDDESNDNSSNGGSGGDTSLTIIIIIVAMVVTCCNNGVVGGVIGEIATKSSGKPK